MDDQTKKVALRMIPYGLFIVSTRRGQEVNAFATNWLSQASFKPPLVMMAVKGDSTSHGMIKESGVFAVNVLAKGQKEMAQQFFRPVERVGNKFGSEPFEISKMTGCPILLNTIGSFECKVVDRIERGDHTVFVGEVVEASVRAKDTEPMLLRETGWWYGG